MMQVWVAIFVFKRFERFKARKGFKASLETIKYIVEGTHIYTEMEAVGTFRT